MTHPAILLDHLDLKLSIGKLVLNVLYIKSGFFYQSMPEHRHSNGSYELHYIPSGRGRLIAEGTEYPLVPGTLYMTGPGIAHEQIPDRSDPMYEYCIFFEALPNGRQRRQSKRETDKTLDDADIADIARLFVDTPFWIGQDSRQLHHSFEKLAEEIHVRSIGYRRSIAILLEQIIIGLVRNYSNNRPALQAAPYKTLDDKRMVLIENNILYNYKQVTIESLAREIGLSVRQTERVVRQQYGMSLREKLLEARMQEAARLLGASVLPIAAIAEHVGYRSAESFASHFKKIYGVTPSAYRARMNAIGMR